MQKTLTEALKSVATFNVKNETQEDVKLALLPGVYSTVNQVAGSGKTPVIAYSDPSNLNNAGYACDQVADDYNPDDPLQKVQVTGANRVRYRDFLNTVQRVAVKVTKIVIQNKNTKNLDVYDQELELSRTAIGAKGGTDYVQLQSYVSVNAYDRTKIEIEFSDKDALYLTPEVFLAMNIPAGANFSIQFVFEAPSYQA